MAAEIPESKPSDDQSHRKYLIIISIFSIALFFLLNDVLRWIEGGGIFSITAAVQAAHLKRRTVDIDGAGLRTLFVSGSILAISAVCLVWNVEIGKRAASLVFWLLAIGGGFVLDGVYDQRIIQSFMTSHGYIRCAAHDYAQGNGKSRVWFDDYVRTKEDCSRK